MVWVRGSVVVIFSIIPSALRAVFWSGMGWDCLHQVGAVNGGLIVRTGDILGSVSLPQGPLASSLFWLGEESAADTAAAESRSNIFIFDWLTSLEFR